MLWCRAVSPSPQKGCLIVVKFYQAIVVGAFVAMVAQSCAGAKVGITSPEESGGAGGSGGGNTTPGGGGGDSTSNFAGLLDAAPNLTPPDTRPGDPPPDLTGCRQDDAGNWICCPHPVSILSLGQPAKYGAASGSADNTDAFQAFMNGNTNGTATMEMLKTFKHITELDLSKYDVIILQALYDNPYDPFGLWSYTDADAKALQDWVSKGGGLVSMSGYFSDTDVETKPLNQLMAPFGISYNSDDVFGADACSDSLCYCSQGSIPFNNWITNTPDCKAITTNSDGSTLGKVGVFHGRTIKCTGADCNVFAKDPKGGGSVGVGKIVGEGRVFAWGDEWVTYTSQWGLTPDPQYDDPVKAAQCVGHTPMTSYSVPQFWYNSFRWLVPWNTCFTIIVPPTADPGQQIIY
jgi:hypothetical protein